MRMVVRTALIAVSVACALPRPAPAADAPRAVVEEITKAALDVLGNKSFSVEDKRHRLEAIVYAHVDFDTMSRLVLARNWSQFSPAQQAEFVNQFKEHLSVTYGRSIENYKNERVEVVGDREEARADWTVKTKILRGGGANDILVDYRLRKEGDAWRIIDIVIERVSLVSNFRSQFQEIVNQGGPAKVLDVLKDKNARGEPLEKS
jgi:phospholipid transport system substrate-binding protein